MLFDRGNEKCQIKRSADDASNRLAGLVGRFGVIHGAAHSVIHSHHFSMYHVIVMDLLTNFLFQFHGHGSDVMWLEAAATSDVMDAGFKRLPRVLVAIEAGKRARLCCIEEHVLAVAV